MKQKLVIIGILFLTTISACKKEKTKTPDVYVAGTEKNDDGNTVAKYWKNGKAINLSDGTIDEDAISIFVVGNNVYVLGYSYGSPHGKVKYWKNGVVTYLTNGTFSAYAKKIIVVNNNEMCIRDSDWCGWACTTSSSIRS